MMSGRRDTSVGRDLPGSVESEHLSSEVHCSQLHYLAMLGQRSLEGALKVDTSKHASFTRRAEALIPDNKHMLTMEGADGRTPLLLAAAVGNTSMVELLLQASLLEAPQQPAPSKSGLRSCSADATARVLSPFDPGYAIINHQDKMGLTAVDYAVRHGHDGTVSLLLGYGADPRVKQVKDLGISVLQVAAMLGKDTLEDALHVDAAEHARFCRLAETFLPSHMNQLTGEDRFGRTPLLLAAAVGNTGMVELLLKTFGLTVQLLCKGTDNGEFSSAGADMHKLVSAAQTRTPRVLSPEDNGYDFINHSDKSGQTALQYAVQHCRIEVMDVLLCYGANPKMGEDPGFTLLHFAALLGEFSLMDALEVEQEQHSAYAQAATVLAARHRPLMDVKDRYGRTALQLAAAIGNAEMVKALLEQYQLGATDSHRQPGSNGSMSTNLQDATPSHRSIRIYPRLDRGYSHVNHRDHEGCTALHYSVRHARNGRHETALSLIQYGADPWAKDKGGDSYFEMLRPPLTSLLALLDKLAPQADAVPDYYWRLALRGYRELQEKPQLYPELVDKLRKVNYRSVKAFLEEAGTLLLEIAMHPTVFVELIGVLRDTQPPDDHPDSNSRAWLMELLELRAGGDMSHKAAYCNRNRRGGESFQGMEWTSLQVLNVRPLLAAAMKAKAEGVEAAVTCIMRMVHFKKSVFLTGITADIIKELAICFPHSCTELLSMVTRDVYEQLPLLPAPVKALHRADMQLINSHVRAPFRWRESDLLKFLSMQQVFDETLLDALVDFGFSFEWILLASDKGVTPTQLSFLIEHGFSAADIETLIVNGVELGEVMNYISGCGKTLPSSLPTKVKAELQSLPMATLLREMLRQGHNPNILGTILREELKLDPSLDIPAQLYVPNVTHHFIQMLLIKWRAVGYDPNYVHDMPLRASIKSEIYLQMHDLVPVAKKSLPTTPSIARLKAFRRRFLKTWQLQCSAFTCNALLLHHWPAFFLGQLGVLLLAACMACVEATCGDDVCNSFLELVSAWGFVQTDQRHFLVEARELVVPWKGIASIHPQECILAALLDANVPADWFGFQAIRTAIGAQWQAFGRGYMLLYFVAHCFFLLIFCCFLMYLPHEYDADVTQVRKHPGIMVLLGLIVIMSISGCAEEGLQMRALKLAWLQDITNAADLSCFMIPLVMAILIWSAASYAAILALGAIEALVLFTRLAFLSAAINDSMGSFMRMVVEIIIDLSSFIWLLVLIFGGFAVAFGVLLDNRTHYGSFALRLFSVMLNEWSSDFLLEMLGDTTVDRRTRWYMPILSVALMCLYGVVILIILVNLLIAVMNDAYVRVKCTEEAEVLQNRARQLVNIMVLLTDRMRSKIKERLLGDYVHVLLPADGLGKGFLPVDSRSKTEIQMLSAQQEIRADLNVVRTSLAELELAFQQLRQQLQAKLQD